jgi:hypothetical protein
VEKHLPFGGRIVGGLMRIPAGIDEALFKPGGLYSRIFTNYVVNRAISPDRAIKILTDETARRFNIPADDYEGRMMIAKSIVEALRNDPEASKAVADYMNELVQVVDPHDPRLPEDVRNYLLSDPAVANAKVRRADLLSTPLFNFTSLLQEVAGYGDRAAFLRDHPYWGAIGDWSSSWTTPFSLGLLGLGGAAGRIGSSVALPALSRLAQRSGLKWLAAVLESPPAREAARRAAHTALATYFTVGAARAVREQLQEAQKAPDDWQRKYYHLGALLDGAFAALGSAYIGGEIRAGWKALRRLPVRPTIRLVRPGAAPEAPAGTAATPAAAPEAAPTAAEVPPPTAAEQPPRPVYAQAPTHEGVRLNFQRPVDEILWLATQDRTVDPEIREMARSALPVHLGDLAARAEELGAALRKSVETLVEEARAQGRTEVNIPPAIGVIPERYAIVPAGPIERPVSIRRLPTDLVAQAVAAFRHWSFQNSLDAIAAGYRAALNESLGVSSPVEINMARPLGRGFVVAVREWAREQGLDPDLLSRLGSDVLERMNSLMASDIRRTIYDVPSVSTEPKWRHIGQALQFPVGPASRPVETPVVAPPPPPPETLVAPHEVEEAVEPLRGLSPSEAPLVLAEIVQRAVDEWNTFVRANPGLGFRPLSMEQVLQNPFLRALVRFPQVWETLTNDRSSIELVRDALGRVRDAQAVLNHFVSEGQRIIERLREVPFPSDIERGRAEISALSEALRTAAQRYARREIPAYTPPPAYAPEVEAYRRLRAEGIRPTEAASRAREELERIKQAADEPDRTKIERYESVLAEALGDLADGLEGVQAVDDNGNPVRPTISADRILHAIDILETTGIRDPEAVRRFLRDWIAGNIPGMEHLSPEGLEELKLLAASPLPVNADSLVRHLITRTPEWFYWLQSVGLDVEAFMKPYEEQLAELDLQRALTHRHLLRLIASRRLLDAAAILEKDGHRDVAFALRQQALREQVQPLFRDPNVVLPEGYTLPPEGGALPSRPPLSRALQKEVERFGNELLREFTPAERLQRFEYDQRVSAALDVWRQFITGLRNRMAEPISRYHLDRQVQAMERTFELARGRMEASQAALERRRLDGPVAELAYEQAHQAQEGLIESGAHYVAEAITRSLRRSDFLEEERTLEAIRDAVLTAEEQQERFDPKGLVSETALRMYRTVIGPPVRIISSRGPLDGYLVVTDADNVVASHDPRTLERNPAYPADWSFHPNLAPVVEQIVRQPDLHQIFTDHPTASSGPPVATAGPNFRVLAGNARTVALVRLLAGPHRNAVLNALVGYLRTAGFSEEQIERVRQMRAPILLRVLPGVRSLRTLNSLSAVLQHEPELVSRIYGPAIADAPRIQAETLDRIDAARREIADTANLYDLIQTRGRQVLEWVQKDGALQDVPPERLFDPATGQLTLEAYGRIRATLLGTIIDDPVLLGRIHEDLRLKLEGILAPVRRIAQAAGVWNIRRQLVEAVRQVVLARERGVPLEQQIAEKTGLAPAGEVVSPVVAALMRVLAESPESLARKFRDYASVAVLPEPPETAEQAFNRVFLGITEERREEPTGKPPTGEESSTGEAPPETPKTEARKARPPREVKKKAARRERPVSKKTLAKRSVQAAGESDEETSRTVADNARKTPAGTAYTAEAFFNDLQEALGYDLDAKEKAALRGLLDARAKATGMTTDEWVEQNIKGAETARQTVTELLQDGRSLLRLEPSSDFYTVIKELVRVSLNSLRPEERAGFEPILSRHGLDDWKNTAVENLTNLMLHFMYHGEAPSEALAPVFDRLHEMIFEELKYRTDLVDRIESQLRRFTAQERFELRRGLARAFTAEERKKTRRVNRSIPTDPVRSLAPVLPPDLDRYIWLRTLSDAALASLHRILQHDMALLTEEPPALSPEAAEARARAVRYIRAYIEPLVDAVQQEMSVRRIPPSVEQLLNRSEEMPSEADALDLFSPGSENWQILERSGVLAPAGPQEPAERLRRARAIFADLVHRLSPFTVRFVERAHLERLRQQERAALRAAPLRLSARYVPEDQTIVWGDVRKEPVQVDTKFLPEVLLSGEGTRRSYVQMDGQARSFSLTELRPLEILDLERLYPGLRFESLRGDPVAVLRTSMLDELAVSAGPDDPALAGTTLSDLVDAVSVHPTTLELPSGRPAPTEVLARIWQPKLRPDPGREYRQPALLTYLYLLLRRIQQLSEPVPNLTAISEQQRLLAAYLEQLRHAGQALVEHYGPVLESADPRLRFAVGHLEQVLRAPLRTPEEIHRALDTLFATEGLGRRMDQLLLAQSQPEPVLGDGRQTPVRLVDSNRQPYIFNETAQPENLTREFPSAAIASVPGIHQWPTDRLVRAFRASVDRLRQAGVHLYESEHRVDPEVLRQRIATLPVWVGDEHVRLALELARRMQVPQLTEAARRLQELLPSVVPAQIHRLVENPLGPMTTDQRLTQAEIGVARYNEFPSAQHKALVSLVEEIAGLAHTLGGREFQTYRFSRPGIGRELLHIYIPLDADPSPEAVLNVLRQWLYPLRIGVYGTASERARRIAALRSYPQLWIGLGSRADPSTLTVWKVIRDGLPADALAAGVERSTVKVQRPGLHVLLLADSDWEHELIERFLSMADVFTGLQPAERQTGPYVDVIEVPELAQKILRSGGRLWSVRVYTHPSFVVNDRLIAVRINGRLVRIEPNESLQGASTPHVIVIEGSVPDAGDNAEALHGRAGEILEELSNEIRNLTVQFVNLARTNAVERIDRMAEVIPGTKVPVIVGAGVSDQLRNRILSNPALPRIAETIGNIAQEIYELYLQHRREPVWPELRLETTVLVGGRNFYGYAVPDFNRKKFHILIRLGGTRFGPDARPSRFAAHLVTTILHEVAHAFLFEDTLEHRNLMDYAAEVGGFDQLAVWERQILQELVGKEPVPYGLLESDLRGVRKLPYSPEARRLLEDSQKADGELLAEIDDFVVQEAAAARPAARPAGQPDPGATLSAGPATRLRGVEPPAGGAPAAEPGGIGELSRDQRRGLIDRIAAEIFYRGLHRTSTLERVRDALIRRLGPPVGPLVDIAWNAARLYDAAIQFPAEEFATPEGLTTGAIGRVGSAYEPAMSALRRYFPQLTDEQRRRAYVYTVVHNYLKLEQGLESGRLPQNDRAVYEQVRKWYEAYEEIANNPETADIVRQAREDWRRIVSHVARGAPAGPAGETVPAEVSDAAAAGGSTHPAGGSGVPGESQPPGVPGGGAGGGAPGAPGGEGRTSGGKGVGGGGGKRVRRPHPEPGGGAGEGRGEGVRGPKVAGAGGRKTRAKAGNFSYGPAEEQARAAAQAFIELAQFEGLDVEIIRDHGRPIVAEDTPLDQSKPKLYAPDQWRALLESLGIDPQHPIPHSALDEDIARVLVYPGQRQVAELALSSLLDRPEGSVLLSLSTGTGKTYISSALVAQLLRRAREGRRRVLILTPNKPVVGKFIRALKEFGLEATDLGDTPRGAVPAEGIHVGTYATGLTREVLRTSWDVVVLDESHVGRKWWSSNTGKLIVRLTEPNRSQFVIFSTATPFHSPAELGYLHRLGLWRRSGLVEWMNKYMSTGFIQREGQLIPTHSLPAPGLQERLASLMLQRGTMISWDRQAQGYHSYFAKVHLPDAAMRNVENIRRAFAMAETYFRGLGLERRALTTRALATQYLKGYVEREKLRQMLPTIRRLLDAGYRVAVFVHYRSERQIPYDSLMRDVRIGREVLPSPNRATEGQIERLLAPLYDVVDFLRAEFGADAVADYTGPSGARREAELQAFQAGTKPLLVSTFDAGGMGVDMHDTVGNAPRAQVFPALPWSSFLLEQAMGRTWRFGTRSDVLALFGVSDVAADRRVALRLLKRLLGLRGAVGNVDRNDPTISRMVAGLRQHQRVHDEMLADYMDTPVEEFSQRVPLEFLPDTLESWSPPPAAQLMNRGIRPVPQPPPARPLETVRREGAPPPPPVTPLRMPVRPVPAGAAVPESLDRATETINRILARARIPVRIGWEALEVPPTEQNIAAQAMDMHQAATGQRIPPDPSRMAPGTLLSAAPPSPEITGEPPPPEPPKAGPPPGAEPPPPPGAPGGVPQPEVVKKPPRLKLPSELRYRLGTAVYTLAEDPRFADVVTRSIRRWDEYLVFLRKYLSQLNDAFSVLGPLRKQFAYRAQVAEILDRFKDTEQARGAVSEKVTPGQRFHPLAVEAAGRLRTVLESLWNELAAAAAEQGDTLGHIEAYYPHRLRVRRLNNRVFQAFKDFLDYYYIRPVQTLEEAARSIDIEAETDEAARAARSRIRYFMEHVLPRMGKEMPIEWDSAVALRSYVEALAKYKYMNPLMRDLETAIAAAEAGPWMGYVGIDPAIDIAKFLLNNIRRHTRYYISTGAFERLVDRMTGIFAASVLPFATSIQTYYLTRIGTILLPELGLRRFLYGLGQFFLHPQKYYRMAYDAGLVPTMIVPWGMMRAPEKLRALGYFLGFGPATESAIALAAKLRDFGFPEAGSDAWYRAVDSVKHLTLRVDPLRATWLVEAGPVHRLMFQFMQHPFRFFEMVGRFFTEAGKRPLRLLYFSAIVSLFAYLQLWHAIGLPWWVIYTGWAPLAREMHGIARDFLHGDFGRGFLEVIRLLTFAGLRVVPPPERKRRGTRPEWMSRGGWKPTQSRYYKRQGFMDFLQSLIEGAGAEEQPQPITRPSWLPEVTPATEQGLPDWLERALNPPSYPAEEGAPAEGYPSSEQPLPYPSYGLPAPPPPLPMPSFPPR